MANEAVFERLIDLSYLEDILSADGVKGLCEAFDGGMAQVVRSSPEWHVLSLFKEAVQLDAAFLCLYPHALLQCLWYRCWWYDCPNVEKFERYIGNSTHRYWETTQQYPLHKILERWWEVRRSFEPDFTWLRALRPPAVPLGHGLLAQTFLTMSGYADGDIEFSSAQTSMLFTIRRWQSGQLMRRSFAWSWADGSIEEYSGTLSYQRHQTPDRRWSLRSLGFGGVAIEDAETHTDVVTIASAEISEDAGTMNALFSPSGQWLVMYGWEFDYDGVLGVWRVDYTEAIPRCTLAFQLHEHSTYDFVGFSSDEALLLLGRGPATTCLEVGTWDEAWRLEGLCHSPQALALSEDRSKLAGVDGRGLFTIWDISKVQSLNPRLHRNTGVVRFSPDGRRLYTRPWLFDGESGELISILDDPVIHYLEGGPPQHNYMLTNERLLKVERGIHCWEVERGQKLSTHKTRLRPGASDEIAFSKDGNMIAVWSRARDGLFVYEIGGEETFLYGKVEYSKLLFSWDHRYLFAGQAERPHIIHVFDVETGRLLHRLRGHKAEIHSMFVSLDGRMLASSGAGEALILWNIERGEQIASRELDKDDPFTSWITIDVEGESQTTKRYFWEPTPMALERLHGWHDFQALDDPKPWWSLVRGNTLHIRMKGSQQSIASFPSNEHPKAHPNGRIWANRHVHLRLEGEPIPQTDDETLDQAQRDLEEAMFFG